MRKRTETFAEGTLGDLALTVVEGRSEEFRLQPWSAAFAGTELDNGVHFIPAADGAGVVRFDDLELGKRFTATQVTDQSAFLRRVRAILDQQKVDDIHLPVQWSDKKKRIVRIRRSVINMDQLLCFSLL